MSVVWPSNGPPYQISRNAFAPYRGQKPPKIGKKGVSESKNPISHHPSKGCSESKNPHFSPKSGKGGFRSQKTPVSHHPRKGCSESKNPHFYAEHCKGNGDFLTQSTLFWETWETGGSLTPKPSFPNLGILTPVRGKRIPNLGPKIEHKLFFLKLFGHFRDIPAKSRDIPPKKVWFPWFRGTYRTFWPPPLHVEDPHPTRKYPDQKVWVWVPFPPWLIPDLSMHSQRA